MRAIILGGDERFRHAAGFLRAMGHCARCAAEWPEEYADVVLAPRQEDIRGENFGLCVLQRGTGSRERTVWLEQDEEYLAENACLTAEGALHAAMGVDGRALYGANCLVTGYGRIAWALYAMLESMNAHVFAAVRPGKSMDRAKRDGARLMDMEQMRARIGEFDYIWNTVPECILSAEDLARIRSGAALFELASAPWGFDMEEAQRRDLWAERLSGLPGKYCPASAGRALARAVDRIYKEERGKAG